MTASQIGRLLSGEGHHRVIVATIRAAEQARLTADALHDDTGRQASRDIHQVLDQAHEIRLTRMFTSEELERARARDWDPRIAQAIDHAGSYGIAEYLAAGPELLRDWEDARASSEGPNARGAALVAAAIDIRRAGYISPLPRVLLEQVHEQYLADREHANAPREPAAEAWEWAMRRRRATTALLRPAGQDLVEVFDYLVDTVQRRAGPLGKVPEPVVRAAIDAAGPADADSLADTAYKQGRYVLAEYAWRQAYQARANDPAIGPDHPDTLTSRSGLANALHDQGKLEQAEAELRAVLETRTRVLGPDHPDTLTSHNDLAGFLYNRGELEQAEAELRAVLEARTRALGPIDLKTLTSRSDLASVLADQGQLEQAETEYRAVIEAGIPILGPDHPDTLTTRNNLATVLAARGKLEQAEAEHRAVLEARIRVNGPDHPHTLTTRNNLAMVLADRGLLEQAEAELRAILEASIGVLGSDHPDTLGCRSNLASVLRDRGLLAQAEAEYRAVLETRTRVLGRNNPHTVTIRNNLVAILRLLGRLEQAEAEQAAPPPETIS